MEQLHKRFTDGVDSHSIFRFVEGRDSFYRKHYLLTDDAETQWKQVLNDCNVRVIYALSPQARGKKDIFSLRLQRTTDAYRKISINNLVLRVNADPYELVGLRIYPLNAHIAEVRFWCNSKLVDVQKVKIGDLKLSTFEL